MLLVGSLLERGVFPFSRFYSIRSLYSADYGQARRSANGYVKAAKTKGFPSYSCFKMIKVAARGRLLLLRMHG